MYTIKSFSGQQLKIISDIANLVSDYIEESLYKVCVLIEVLNPGYQINSSIELWLNLNEKLVSLKNVTLKKQVRLRLLAYIF